MEITVTLILSGSHNLTAEEIEKDLRMNENEIGWNHDYTIKSVKVTYLKGTFAEYTHTEKHQ